MKLSLTFRKACTVAWQQRKRRLTTGGGGAYQRKHNLENTVIDFNGVLVLEPKHTGAYYSRGICLFARKEFRRAIEDFTADLDINPGDGYSLHPEFSDGHGDLQETRRGSGTATGP